MKTKNILLTLSFSIFHFYLLAQNIVLSDVINQNEQSVSDYTILNKYNSNSYLHYKTDLDYLICFDQTMKKVWEKPIPLKEKELIDICQIDSSFYIFFKEKVSNKYRFGISKFALITDDVKEVKRMILDTLSKSDNNYKESIILSDNNQYLGIIKYEDGDTTIQYAIFDDNLKTGGLKSSSVPSKSWKMTHNLLSDDGNFEFILQNDDERNSESSSIIVNHSNSETRDEFDFYHQKISSLTTTYDNQNHQIIFVALISDLKSRQVTKIAALTLKNGIIDSLTSNINSNYAFITNKGSSKKSASGFDDYIVRKIIPKSNGGFTVIMEQYNVVQSQSYFDQFGSNSGMYYGGNDNFYAYDNTLLIDFNSRKEIDWDDLIQKNQVSKEDNGKNSSFFVANTQNYIYLLYNDEISSQATVVSNRYTASGTLDRTVILNNKKLDILLRPRYGKQISDKTVVLPSYYRNELKFLKIDLP